MMGSPFDGSSRRTLRVGLAVIGALLLLTQAFEAHMSRPGPGAPLLLRAIVHDAVAVPLALAGAAALVLFARRPAALAPGAAALLVMTVFAETHRALSGGTSHFPFAAAATLLGWLCGLGYARLRGPEGAPPGSASGDRAEVLAEAGAVALLAATYVNAGVSKLLESGVAWADGAAIDAAILSLHGVDDGSALGAFARFVVEHRGAARALASASLIIEAGAFLYVLHPRLRMIWGALILSFHLNVLLLLGIPYVLSWATVLLFSFPWPRIAGRGEPHGPGAGPPRSWTTRGFQTGASS